MVLQPSRAGIFFKRKNIIHYQAVALMSTSGIAIWLIPSFKFARIDF